MLGWAAVALAAWAIAAAAQESLRAEPLPDDAAPPVVEPTQTRRPRPRTPTPSATPTDTATAIPPTRTATATGTATATATVPPTATATPSPTPALLARAFAIGDASHAPWVALGGLLTLVAVWLGARLGGARERLARKRARTTLASAMLLELRRLDAVLRRLVALDNPTSFPSLDHPIMEASLRDLTLFHGDTAARIAQFHGALRGIQHEIGEYRDNPMRWAGRLGELNQLIKTRATVTCRAVPALMQALEKEGGTPPPSLGEPAAARDGERLPPPPFGDTEGDDWTL